MNRNSYAEGKKVANKFPSIDTFNPFLMGGSPEEIATMLRTGTPLIYVMSNDPARLSKEVDDLFYMKSIGSNHIPEEYSQNQDVRTYGFFHWRTGDGLYHAHDPRAQERRTLDRGEVVLKTWSLPRVPETTHITTLEKTVQFFESFIPANIRYDADGYIIKFDNMKELFENREICKGLRRIIDSNEFDENLVRKMFLMIGSEPYLPIEFQHVALLARHDYKAEEAEAPRPCDVNQTLRMFRGIARLRNFNLKENADWLGEEIKDLTQKQADDILSYLIFKYGTVDQAKLRQFKQDIALQNELFKYIG